MGLAAEYSDNVALAPEGEEESGSVAIAVANLRATQRTIDSDVSVLGSLQYRDYRTGPFSDEFLLSLAAAGEWALDDKGTKWFLEDRFDQADIDVLAPSTPENRQDANAFSTGPEARWHLSPSQSVVAGARYANFYFEESDTDSHRLSGYGRWLYAMSRPRDLSANLEASAVDFIDEAFGDYRRADGYLRLENRWARSVLEADVGGTAIRRDRADDVNGFLGRLRWRLSVNSYSGLEGTVISQYTDVGAEFAAADTRDSVGVFNEPITGDVYYNREGALAYDWHGVLASLRAAGAAGSDDYRASDNDRNYQEAAIGVGYDLSVTLHLAVDAYYERSEYEEVNEVVTDRTAALRLSYQVNPRVLTSLRIGRTERDTSDPLLSYTENRALVSINYGYPRRDDLPPADTDPLGE